MTITKKTICPLDCPDTCGILATVENGRVLSLTGDPAHPFTKGVICRKMKKYPQRLYSDHRILFPQIRAGAKGEGRFKRISWDEAFNHIAVQLQETMRLHGGESILPFSYAGNMGLVNRFAGFPLFNKIGTLETKQTICSAAAAGGWKMMCGNGGGCSPEVAESSKLILLWGINVRVSNMHFWRSVKNAQKAGARVVVIDPYKNDTARLADDYIRVLPGGDSALALGVLKVLVENGWIDTGFIESETDGFEQLARYVRETSLSRFESVSGTPATVMTELASLFRQNPKTFIRIGVGLTRNSRGGMAVRAITSLAAACGLFDGGEGRGVLLFSGAFTGNSDRLAFPDLAERQRRTVNMIHLGQTLTATDPRVRALIVYNANPVSVVPDGSGVRDGLCREDLFTVVHEQVMSPTASFADILLPATTFLENRDCYSSYGHFYFGLAEPVVEPLGEAKSNFDFFQILAGRMGFTDAPFRQSIDDRINSYLETLSGVPEDFNWQKLRGGTYVESIYNSQEGSVLKRKDSRFRFVNSDDPTMPPFACLTESSEFDHPDLTSRFPYKLITPPDNNLLNSTFGEFFNEHPGCVLIHPVDAAELGICGGEMVELHNFRGKTVRQAVITDDTQSGLLVAEGLYWPPAGTKTGINDLVSQKCSDIGGGALFHETRVRVAVLSKVRQDG